MSGNRSSESISLTYLLRKKDTQYDVANFHKQKYSNISLTSSKSSDTQSCTDTPKEEVHLNSTLHYNHVQLKPPPGNNKTTGDDATRVTCLVEHITSKFKRRHKVPHFRIRRKHTWWYKISNLVHLKKKTARQYSATTHSEKFQGNDDEPTKVCNVLLKPEELKRPAEKFHQKDISSEERKPSWQPSKPSVSNWNRSELFTHSVETINVKQNKNRRKTLSGGMLVSSGHSPDKLFSTHEKVQGILMSGSDMNSRDDATVDISPMSSNYSLTPSTTESEEDDNDEKDRLEEVCSPSHRKAILARNSITAPAPELPAEYRLMINNIVMGIKDKVDALIMESEKKTIDEIIQLKERIKQQDALIEYLEARCSKEPADEPEEKSACTEQHFFPSEVHSFPPNKSEDTAISTSEATSPGDLMSDVKFEEEDMWLVEFPPNLLVPTKTTGRSRLRRHSSVEVGHELPFRLSSSVDKPATETFLKPVVHREEQISPRRFSESQARPDVVHLNSSFAAKVRRVLAKVRVNRESEDPSTEETSPQSTFKWPSIDSKKEEKRHRRSSTGSTNERLLSGLFQPKSATPKKSQGSNPEPPDNSRRYGSDGKPKRVLPTITESSSFDSLRESPLFVHGSHVAVTNTSCLNSELPVESVVIDMTTEEDLCIKDVSKD